MVKMLMYVYSDIKTDARVMRAVQTLKKDYDITLIATCSDIANTDFDGYEFVESIENKNAKPLVKYLQSLRCAVKHARSGKYEIVYAHDYYAAPLIAYFKKNVKSIYDAHELYVSSRESSLREKICCHIEKKAIERADLVICASERRKQIMTSLYKTKKDIVPIGNVSILPEVSQLTESKIWEEIPGLSVFLSSDIPTVVYCGALIRARRVDLLIEAVSKCQKPVQLLIVGNGNEKDNLVHRAKELNLQNVFWCKAVPYKYIRSIVSRCKVGFLYYENDTLNNKNCAPNKIYEYASAMLPMIGNNNEGLKDIINRYNIGIIDDDITASIEEVCDNHEYYVDNILQFLKENSWEIQAERLKESVLQV